MDVRSASLLGPATVGIAQTDLTGRFVMVNQRFCDMLGRSREELLTLRMQDVTHPDDLGHSLAEFDGMFESGEGFSIENRYVRPEGSVIWSGTTVSLLRDAEGDPRYAIAVLQDITPQKQTEAALRNALRELAESKARYRMIGEAIDFGVWICNAEGELLYCSQSLLDLLGMTLEEVAGLGWYEALHPDDVEATATSWAHSVRTGEDWSREHRYRGADGCFHPVLTRGKPLRNEDGQISSWIGINLDIADLKRTEQALRESEQRLQLAQSAAAIGSWDWNPVTDQSRWSPEQFALLGLDPASGVAPSYSTLMSRVHPGDREKLQAAVDDALRNGTYGAEFRILRGDEIRWLLGRGTVLYDPSGRPIRMVGVNLDVTEGKRNEQALREATRAKNRLLAAAGHDLKQPLQVVLGALDRMMAAKTAEERERYFEKGERSVHRLVSALDSLLVASRLELGGVQPVIDTFSIGPVIDSLNDSFADQARARGLRLTFLPSSLLVRTDPDLLLTILSNLISNAIKYTEKGGVLVGCRRRGGVVSIEVVDTGIGIPPGQVDRIFEEFQQVDERHDGFGLGLSIVKRTAEILGLTIGVYSRVGHGSRFTIEIPLAAKQDGRELQRAVPELSHP